MPKSLADAFAGSKSFAALDEVNATAAGTGDATEVNGLVIDTLGFDCVSVLIPFRAALQEGETLSIACTVQECDTSGGTYTDAPSSAPDYQPAGGVVATGGTGDTTEKGVYRLDVKTEGLKRYVRVQVTPNLSASGTDTATLMGVALLGGSDVVPAREAPTGAASDAGKVETLGYA